MLLMTSIVMVARLDEEGIRINVICLEQLFQVLCIHVYQNFATIFNEGCPIEKTGFKGHFKLVEHEAVSRCCRVPHTRTHIEQVVCA